MGTDPYYGIEFNIICAMDSERGIGRNGTIPWHLPEDLRRFQELTKGGIVIMGRKTWESLPVKPLPDRSNIVLCSEKIKDFPAKTTYKDGKIEETVSMCFSLEFAIEKSNRGPIWVIGGQGLYDECIHWANKIYLTHIDKEFKCDRWFPPVPDHFKTIESSGWKQHKKLNYWFEVLQNVNRL